MSDIDLAYYNRFLCPTHDVPYWQCECEPATAEAKINTMTDDKTKDKERILNNDA